MCSNKSMLAMGLTLQLMLTVAMADVSHLDSYSISSSSQLGAYHYPVPQIQLRTDQQHHQHQQQVARHFVDPSLDHAAFTQALTRSGYVFGNGNTASASAQLSSVVPATGRFIGSPAVLADSNSLNLKLPVPFGSMPLNVANLPLQAGASYATVPHTTGLTSYGTAQIQRR